MSEETAKRIATALENIAFRVLFIMAAAIIIAGQMFVFNLNHPH